MRDECVPAGATLLTRRWLICCAHGDEREAATKPMRQHLDYCDECGGSGQLLCCERCPLVSHARCAGLENEPDEWKCISCRAGHEVHFGDLLWVKLGNYRLVHTSSKLIDSYVTCCSSALCSVQMVAIGMRAHSVSA